MQARTSFFVALFFVLFFQTVSASRALARVNAGPGQNVNEGDTVFLDGSKSQSGNPNNTILSYQWKQVEIEGHPEVILVGADQAIASFIAPQVLKNTKLIFQLKVTFSFGQTGKDNTGVRVLQTEDPPIADAGPDQIVAEEITVILDGSNSFDPDPGDSIIYQWQQTGGSPTVALADVNTAKASFVAPIVGPEGASLTFELTVTDRVGFKDTDSTIVDVRFVNDPPTADAGPDQNVDEQTTVILDGSNSFDPDDGIESYRWKQIVGPSVSLSDPEAVQPTFLAPDVGPDGVSFTFELTVTDFGGLQSSDTAIVNVTWLNDPPTANAGVDQTVLEKSTVTLDGSNSSDPDDGIESYRWKQVAGRSVTFSDPTEDRPTFEAPSFDDNGDHPLVFELVVTDDGGLQSSDSTTVSVSNFEKDNPGASGGGCFIATAADG
jgi:hypothetical protein